MRLLPISKFILRILSGWFLFWVPFIHVCIHKYTQSSCIHRSFEALLFKDICDSVGPAESLAPKLDVELLCGKAWAQDDLQYHQLSGK